MPSIHQMKIALKKCEGKFLITKTQGRIFVEAEGEFDYEETVDALQHVFGIAGICPMIYVEEEGFEKLCETVVNYVDQVYPDKNKTFKVHCRRARKNYPKESMEDQRGSWRGAAECVPGAAAWMCMSRRFF